jgi:hypothetical protein
LLRGVIGFLIGSLAGGVAGFTVNLINVERVSSGNRPNVFLPVIGTVLSLGGAAAGTYIGARKPEC